MTVIVVGLVLGLIVLGILGYPSIRQWQRDRLKQRPFPLLWQGTITQQILIIAQLSAYEQQRLQGHIQVFLAEKQFIGCRGLQVTQEMKVIIAAIACLLLLNEQGNYFPKLRSILVYPDAYWVNETVNVGHGIVENRKVARLGESWSVDQVILSWAQVEYDLQHWSDGKNVVLHEFAHQLDQADGRAEGVPILQNQLDYSTWATVMTEAYQQLCDNVSMGNRTVLDSYGTLNPAEFFAVATETFFEKPQSLKRQHLPLYNLLRSFYQIHLGND
jgi:MtfA peptidase